MSQDVVVLSAAPALDRTMRVAGLRRGGVHRPTWSEDRAGGKGANVARTLRSFGVPAVLVTALGGVHGTAFRSLAAAEGLALAAAGCAELTRVCTTVVDDDAVTSFYELPSPIAKQTWSDLQSITRGLLPAAALVISGTLPAGVSHRSLRDLVVAARRSATPVWADVSGQALVDLVQLGAVVWPNLYEAQQALGAATGEEPAGGATGGLDEAGRAAVRLVELGAAAAVVSCGADGVAVAGPDGTATHLPAAQTDVVNPVGAGDVLLGATLAHLHQHGESVDDLDRLRSAVARGVQVASRSCQTWAAADLPPDVGAGVAARAGSQ